MEYAKELENIENEIKRVNRNLKVLRERKKELRGMLYKVMKDFGYRNLGGYKIDKIKPKEKAKRKSVVDQRRDALAYLRSYGIPDPENFYVELEEIKRKKIPPKPQ